MQASLDAVCQQFEAWTHISHDLALRKIHSLYVRRGVAYVDDLRTFRTHYEWRLLDRIVPDSDDQIGLINGFVNVVALSPKLGA